MMDDDATNTQGDENDLEIKSGTSNDDYSHADDLSVSSTDVYIGSSSVVANDTMDGEAKTEENDDEEEETDPQMANTARQETRRYEGSAETTTRSSSAALTNAIAARNRCMMTVVHFVLTYPRWSIMLFLIFATMTYPLPTVEEQVTIPLRDLTSLVQTESNMYHECVATGFQFLDYHMNNTIHQEEKQVNSTKLNNTFKLKQAAYTSSQCQNATIASQRALQTWYKLSDLPVPRKSSSSNVNQSYTSYKAATDVVCTIQDQDRLRTMLNDGLAMAQDNVMSLLDDYVSQTLASIQKIADYTAARSAYDYEYFIGIKFRTTFELLNNLTAPNIHLTLHEQEIRIELHNILARIIEALKAAYVQIDLLKSRLIEFKISIEAFYLHYMDLYNRFELINNFIQDFIPVSVQLPSYFDISELPTADLLLPQLFEVPDFDVNLLDIDTLVSEFVQRAIVLVTKILVEAAKEASEQTQLIIEQIISTLRELLTLEDYNPPKYPVSTSNPQVHNPTDEIKYMNVLADTIQAKTDAALKKSQRQQDNLFYQNPSIPKVDETKTDFNNSDATKFPFLEASLPQMNIPVWIMKILGWFCSRSIIIECLMQFLRLWRLKRKYERNAQPDLPEINYIGNENDHDTGDNSGGNSRTFDLIRITLLRYLMNPWVIVAIMFVPAISVILVFWFPHVKESCIDSRRGTFLARHVMTPILVNKANALGNALYTTSMLSCQRKQLSVCALKQSESGAVYQEDLNNHLEFESRFNDSLTVLGILDRCVDTEWIDSELRTNCCGLQGYTIYDQDCSANQKKEKCPIDGTLSPPSAFCPLGETMMDPACKFKFNETNLEDSTFNCKVLDDACKEVACSGVDADLILRMTIDADCSAEVYGIQLSMFIALVVYHAIMINIINTLLFNGILSLSWRKLRPDGIKMIAHIDERDGKILKGATRKERLTRVTNALRLYERFGRVQIALCILFLIAWLASFIVLSKVASDFGMYHG